MSARHNAMLLMPCEQRCTRARSSAARKSEVHATMLRCQMFLQVWGAASAVAPQFAAIDRLVAANLRRVQVPALVSGGAGFGFSRTSVSCTPDCARDASAVRSMLCSLEHAARF